MTEPYFPPPRPKPTGYRAPAEGAPLVVDPPKRVVQRPESPPDSRPRTSKEALARELVAAVPRERTYWERHRTFARYPRAFGALLIALGGLLVAADVDTLVHGGWWRERSAVMGPMALIPGLFFVIFGYPLGEDGRVPTWYAKGLFASVGVAFVSGILFAVVGETL